MSFEAGWVAKSMVVALALTPGAVREPAPSAVQAAARLVGDSLTLTPGARMVAAARQLIAQTHDNAYSFVADIEPEKGVFHADCSELIDYLAQQVDPAAVAQLPRDVGHAEPRAENLYDFFKAASPVDMPPANAHWGQVAKPVELQPGDVIAWKNLDYQPGLNSTGHVMLVSEVPHAVTSGDTVLGYDVPVIDATSHGHGPGDPRAKGGSTGLGQGTIFLPTDARGQATGFSWTPPDAPDALPPRPPTVAFGRLLGGDR